MEKIIKIPHHSSIVYATLLQILIFSVECSVTSTYVIKPTEDKESPPIDPFILKHLSTSLTPEECMKVYGFLVVRNSVSKLHKVTSLNATVGYASFLQKTHKNLIFNTPSKNAFDCLSSLMFWNVQLIGVYAKDMIDRKHFAETLLRIALNSIQRIELSQWVFNATKTRRHVELQELQKEIESHLLSREAVTEVLDKSRGFVIYLLVFGVLGVILCITLCITVIIWSHRNVKFPHATSTTVTSSVKNRKKAFKVKSLTYKLLKKDRYIAKNANASMENQDIVV